MAGQCEVCRQWCDAGLCAGCLEGHGKADARCAQCAIALPSPAASVCQECLDHPPAFAATHCVADYGFPWARLISRLKYHGEPGLADALARPMAALCPCSDAQRWLLPMPLSPLRLKARGFNQAWELARRIGRWRGVPARADVLWRVLDTPAAQAELGRRERLKALVGAFMVAPAAVPELRGRTVTLVDDVMTTGASANEAARTLLRAGANGVEVLVFARTPAPADAGPDA